MQGDQSGAGLNMKLNLPVLDLFASCRSILVAGMGGGFDVLCGLPIFLELEQLGYDVHLANLSFSDIADLTDGEALTDTLVGVSADLDEVTDYYSVSMNLMGWIDDYRPREAKSFIRIRLTEYYFPEYFLAQWLFDERNDDVTIWCFQKTGARPLIKNYQVLAKHLRLDAIILVDGGVDSLMHGDEPQPGTLLEDSLSLLAVSELTTVPVRLMACLGLGIEPEVGYAHLFENIAHLTRAGAFRGSCALLKDMPSFQQFEQAALYMFDQQPDYPSVIASSVISAVHGEYGNYHLIRRTQGSTLRISPLMALYWFFDLPPVAQRNLLLPALRLTHTVDEAWTAMQMARDSFTPRKTPEYPLP